MFIVFWVGFKNFSNRLSNVVFFDFEGLNKVIIWFLGIFSLLILIFSFFCFLWYLKIKLFILIKFFFLFFFFSVIFIYYKILLKYNIFVKIYCLICLIYKFKRKSRNVKIFCLLIFY